MVYSLTWLPAVLEGAGLKIAEVQGWRTRGRGDVGRVRGVICHHTAGPRVGNMPSLDLIVNGRTDLHGPLAQLGLGRDGTFYVIAAGRANHAGPGVWRTIETGNSSFIGIEAENRGTRDDSWPQVQMEAFHRGVAAILRQLGADERMVCGHREYARPKGRKIDPLFDMADFREEVAAILQGRAPPPRLIPAIDARQRPTLRRGAKGPLVSFVQRVVGAREDADFGGRTEALVRAFQRARSTVAATLVPDGIVGPKTWSALDAAQGAPTAPSALASAPPALPTPTGSPAGQTTGSPPPSPSVLTAAVTPAAAPTAAGASATVPIADDGTHRVTVRDGRAFAPDGTRFASVRDPGFQTPGETTIKAWIAATTGGASTFSRSVLAALGAISDNEGRFEAVNSYDPAHMSFGIMQWTAGKQGDDGELGAMLARLKARSPEAFADCFGRYGMDCESAPGAMTGSISLEGRRLASSDAKNVLRSATWAYRFWRAGHAAQVRDAQLAHAVGRVDVFSKIKLEGHPIGDWVSSEVGITLLLDQHVNRPSEVATVLGKAVKQILAKGRCEPDPAAWSAQDEAALMEAYLALRMHTAMTSAEQRGRRILALAAAGRLSAARGSFARSA